MKNDDEHDLNHETWCKLGIFYRKSWNMGIPAYFTNDWNMDLGVRFLTPIHGNCLIPWGMFL